MQSGVFCPIFLHLCIFSIRNAATQNDIIFAMPDGLP